MNVIHALEIKELKDNLINILKHYKDDSDLVDVSDIRKFVVELYFCNRPWLSGAFHEYLYYSIYKKVEITVRDLKDFIKRVKY